MNRHLLITRIEAEDAAGLKVDHSVRSLSAGAGVDRLVEVEATIGPPLRGVYIVVAVFGAEAAQHDVALIGDAVAIGVAKVKELGALGDIDAAVAGQHAGGDE